jgi:hypothetical protein
MTMNRKQVKAAARALRAKPGWQPSPHTSPNAAEELNRVSELARADKLEETAKACPDCLRRRESLGDETAFCDTHMREVLGF